MVKSGVYRVCRGAKEARGGSISGVWGGVRCYSRAPHCDEK